MDKLKKYAWTIGRWIVIGLSVLLAAILYGRRAKGLKIETTFDALKTEENSRSVQDATHDAELTSEKSELAALPKTVSQMSDKAVNDELNKRGLD